jgi:hypothetical protein
MKGIAGTWWPADRVEIDLARNHMQSALPESFADLWRQGRAMTLDEAIAYATSSG